MRPHRRSGEPREITHFCLLTGFGAGAVNPYLAYETLKDLVRREAIVEEKPGQAVENYIHAIEKGLLKVMSKIVSRPSTAIAARRSSRRSG